MINTKVARILSPTEVILAAGSEKGVCAGTEFIIFDLSEPIPDPETGESLGQLEIVKGRVRVTHVQEKISKAMALSRSVTRTVDVRVGAAISAMFEPRQVTETEYDALKVEGAVAVKTDLTVRVGDRARSVE